MTKTITTLDKIDRAVENVKIKYPQANLERIFAYLALNLQITNENIGRKVEEEFKDINRVDLIREMISNALVMSQTPKLEVIPCTDFCKQYLEFIEANNLHEYRDEIISETLNEPNLISMISVAFAAQRYENGIKYEEKPILDDEIRDDVISIKKTNKDKARSSIFGKINNFYFNRTKVDVIRNSQVKKNHIDYQVDNNMYASMNAGEIRSALTDSALMIDHPNNYKFRLVAIASNSVIHGNKVSNAVMRSLLKWFENLSKDYYEDIDGLKELLENKMIQISNEIRKLGKCSLTCAIIGKDKTLVYSIGETRGYKVINNKLVGLTVDDTYIGRLCAKGILPKFESRFYKGNNLVLNELGGSEKEANLRDRSEAIPNDYDKLLLVTRGVTKAMDDQDIELILAREKDPEVVKEIVKKASTESSSISDYKYGYFTSYKPGDENSTALMYVKRK